MTCFIHYRRILAGALFLFLGVARHAAVYGQDHLELSHRIDAIDELPVRILPDNVEAPEFPETAWENLSRYWQELISDYQLPGAAIAVVQADGAVFELCVGKRNVREDAPIDAQTRFNIGEATLALTTLMAATADRPDYPVFDRRADSVSPLFRMTDRQALQQCRLRDLLTMTAGAPPYTDQILDPMWTRPEDVFALLGQAPVMSPPGQRFRRSQISATVGGYLSAMLASKQRGNLYENYTAVCAERIFTPLAMSRATFSPRQVKDDVNHAIGHAPAEFGFNPVFIEEPERNPLAPLLGLKLSLDDAVRWLQAELRQGQGGDGQAIAPGVSVRERWQPAVVQNSDHRGMGWTRRYQQEVEIIQASGSYGAQSASIGFYPAYRTGYVVLTNASGEDADRLLQAVALGVAEVLKESRQSTTGPAVASE